MAARLPCAQPAAAAAGHIIRRETTGVRWSSQKGTTSSLGDNRDNSLDSRYWGFVADSLIKGRPFVIYYSYSPDSLRTQLGLAHAHSLDAAR